VGQLLCNEVRVDLADFTRLKKCDYESIYFCFYLRRDGPLFVFPLNPFSARAWVAASAFGLLWWQNPNQ